MSTSIIKEQESERQPIKGFALSVVFHFVLLLSIYFFSRFDHKKEPFKKVSTFTLVTLQDVAAPPVQAQTAAPHIKESAPIAKSVTQSTQPSLTPDVTPVPSQHKSTDTTTTTTPQRSHESAVASNPSGSNGGSGISKTSEGPVRIGSASLLDNTDFDPIYQPSLAYPPIAKKAGLEGYVDAELLIDEMGLVDDFKIISVVGHPSFATETAKILPTYRFPPPRINGKKVRIKYLYRINFQLQ